MVFALLKLWTVTHVAATLFYLGQTHQHAIPHFSMGRCSDRLLARSDIR